MRPTPRCRAPLECMVHSLVRQSTRHVVPAPTVQAVWRLVDPRVRIVGSRIRVVPRDKILHTSSYGRHYSATMDECTQCATIPINK